MKFKRWMALLLAGVMTFSLAACGNNAGSTASEETGSTTSEETGSQEAEGDTTGQAATGEKIVVWTLAADLEQFAARYTEEIGRASCRERV